MGSLLNDINILLLISGFIIDSLMKILNFLVSNGIASQPWYKDAWVREDIEKSFSDAAEIFFSKPSPDQFFRAFRQV